MRNFGVILRYFRTQSNISMASLAEGICTKHYVYLIESGKRIPSVKIVDELSAKLSFDWRDYVEYANNSSPIEAKHLMDQIERYNRISDMDSLCSLINSLPDKPYLQCYPIYIEIWIQKILVYICGKDKKVKDLKSAKTSLAGYVEPLLERDNFVELPFISIKAIIVYSALLLKKGQLEKCHPVCRKLIASLNTKKHILRYQPLYVSAHHNIMICCKKLKDFKRMRSCGIMLMNYQEGECLIEKLPITLILLGDAYKGLQKYTTAFKYYKKAISVSRILKNNYFCEIAEERISRLY